MPKQQFATRPWRAIHDSWLVSERLSSISDPALILWHMLNTRQDDAGRFHWTQVRVRALVAVRSWTFSEASKYLAELAHVGSVSVDSEWVTLHRGAELNGTPTSGSKDSLIPRFYPGYTSGIPKVESESTLDIPPVESKYIVGTMKQIETKRDETSIPNGIPPKGGKTPNPLVSETMNELEKLRTYPSAAYAQEASAVKWLLDHGYSQADILVCYVWLKLDPFWADPKSLSMSSLKTRIGAWVAAGRPKDFAAPPALFRPGPSANGPAPSRANEPDYSEDQLRIADQMAHRAKVKGGLP